jgi:hypothetical protein
MKTNKVILSAILYLLIINNLFSQDKPSISIQIEQQVLPGGVSHLYKLTNRNVKVFKKTFDERNIFLTSRRLTNNQYDSIQYYIKQIFNNYYRTSYYGGELDGVNWQFKFQYNDSTKNIRVDNYYLPILDKIVILINQSLPTRKRYIRMDYFDFKKKYWDENKSKAAKTDNMGKLFITLFAFAPSPETAL